MNKVTSKIVAICNNSRFLNFFATRMMVVVLAGWILIAGLVNPDKMLEKLEDSLN